MTKTQIQYIEKNANQLSCREISRNIQINYSAVRKYCLEHNILFFSRKNNGNSFLFETITDSSIAYLLGFLWADGYIGYSKKGIPTFIGVEILLRDSDILENLFQTTFKKYGKYIRLRKGKQNPVVAFHVNDMNLTSLFISKFEFEKKSFFFPKISKFIPIQFQWHFLRGYFDGDGCIDEKRISISSTFENDWSELISFCQKNEIDVGKIRRYKHPIRSHCFSAIRMNQENSKKFLDLVYLSYPNDKIGLRRKYNLYFSNIRDG